MNFNLKKFSSSVILFVVIVLGFSFMPSRSMEGPTIVIQPFSDLPVKYSAHVYKQLIKLYPHVIMMKPIDLPKTAYYSPRNRYRADTLLTI